MAKHTVFRMHELEIQRASAQEFPTELRKPSSGRGHLEVAQHRTNGLGRQACVVDADLDPTYFFVRVGFPDHGIVSTLAEWIDSIELVLGPSVPEVALIEDGVDHRGGVSRCDASRVQVSHMEDVIGSERGFFRLSVATQSTRSAQGDALGSGDIVDTGDDFGVTIVHVRELVEREVGFGERVIRSFDLERIVRIAFAVGIDPEASGVQLVLDAVVSSGVEVASRTGRPVVAADTHVPEQCLPENDCGLLILDEFRKIGRLRNDTVRERFRRWRRLHFRLRTRLAFRLPFRLPFRIQFRFPDLNGVRSLVLLSEAVHRTSRGKGNANTTRGGRGHGQEIL